MIDLQNLFYNMVFIDPRLLISHHGDIQGFAFSTALAGNRDLTRPHIATLRGTDSDPLQVDDTGVFLRICSISLNRRVFGSWGCGDFALLNTSFDDVLKADSDRFSLSSIDG